MFFGTGEKEAFNLKFKSIREYGIHIGEIGMRLSDGQGKRSHLAAGTDGAVFATGKAKTGKIVGPTREK